MENIPNILWVLLFGAVAGWLASMVVGGGGGLIRNIIIGLVGSVVGSPAVPRAAPWRLHLPHLLKSRAMPSARAE